MKRKPIIVVGVTVALLAVGAGIWVNHLATQKTPTDPRSLTEPIPLVEIPAGEFMMGSPETEAGHIDYEVQHAVKIGRPFWMGKTEVTQRQWFEIMGTTVRQQYNAEDPFKPMPPHLWKRIKRAATYISEMNPNEMLDLIRWVASGDEQEKLYGEGDDYPMYFVNEDEAMAFCAQLTERERAVGRLPSGHEYRLPTEAEWEYTCRAGSTTRFANGDTETDLDSIGWYESNSGNTSHPVGMKHANAWGLYDMHGNVEEWCWDWHDDYPTNKVIDPLGTVAISNSKSYRVIRGGSWSDSPLYCRAAHRGGWGEPHERFRVLVFRVRGFRVVLAPIRPRQRETGGLAH
jgi:formylglycine-generating enzyme required for sulfatase activity